METLASVWDHEPDPTDICDLDDPRNRLSTAWESKCAFTPPGGQMWTQQLSPHLQRNKQLQDTLLQREEELARLQEENNKLRGFLNSSFVRNLQEAAEKLTADRRRKLKRNLTNVDPEPSEISGCRFSRPIAKRLCRNLTAEFCSGSSDGSACSEPNLDLWVLRTLGLKDRNTIDTSDESPSERSFRDLLYDGSVAPSLAAELETSFSSPATMSTLSPVHSYCPTPTGHMDYSSSDCLHPAVSNVPATMLMEHHEICSVSGVQPLETSAEPLSSSWCPHPGGWTPSQQVCFPPRSASCSELNKCQAPPSSCSPTASDSPQSPHKPADVAFSMSLSPSSSVKTHSFPQGQAFIRKDAAGRWNFTWVPRQEP